jgi:hypothetical protein
MPIVAISIMFSIVFLSGIVMAIFSDRLVDWITRFWDKITRSDENDANLRLRKIEIWIYRIFGIFFAVFALVMLILVLLSKIL